VEKSKKNIMEDKRSTGCCGANCSKCRSFIRSVCMGCKGGYDTGERHINKSRCKIKLCCFRDKKIETCSDCSKLNECEILKKKIDSGMEKQWKLYKTEK
jgi:hypothetical protein